MSKMEAKQFYVKHSLNKKMTLRQIINMSWKQSGKKGALHTEEIDEIDGRFLTGNNASEEPLERYR